MWLKRELRSFLFPTCLLLLASFVEISRTCLTSNYKVDKVNIFAQTKNAPYHRCLGDDGQVSCRTQGCHDDELQVPPLQTFVSLSECLAVEPNYVLCYNPNGFKCRTEVEMCDPDIQLRVSSFQRVI